MQNNNITTVAAAAAKPPVVCCEHTEYDEACEVCAASLAELAEPDEVICCTCGRPVEEDDVFEWGADSFHSAVACLPNEARSLRVWEEFEYEED